MAKKRKDEADEAEIIDAWALWVQTIPDEDRQAVAAIIRKCDITSKAGLNHFYTQLLAALFSGAIHPVVLAAAKPVLQMMMTNVYMMHAEAGTTAMVGTTGAQLMIELRDQVRQKVRPLEPVYTFESISDEDEEDIIDAAAG